ncbi:hypothetical protein J1605_013627 [Eschrichtius robustus]|uniref:Secreted protein n=1 Tax=Eschrichtius robustus TaxID=9764 RepID=A0AB34GIW4_ESCRO|nr:hypothetical protein J1605_013627 [Eschrichtius robustus]
MRPGRTGGTLLRLVLVLNQGGTCVGPGGKSEEFCASEAQAPPQREIYPQLQLQRQGVESRAHPSPDSFCTKWGDEAGGTQLRRNHSPSRKCFEKEESVRRINVFTEVRQV